jgi:precorrin-6Y C5,15-methyltransferase (decarboxylating)
MFHGVGASLTRIVPARETRVIPAPSSLSLAAARMGWPLQDVTVLSLHGRPLELAHPHIHPDARLLVLSDSGATPSALAALLRARGFGASTLVVLEHLGGDRERRRDGIAATWMDAECAALNIIAVECHAQLGTWILSCLPGLPDDAFEHDGQLTKRDIRAMTLARLAPSPGGLLWDVGAGCGSIGIEWMRAHPACRTIAIESKPRRQAFITRNRNALGVPTLHMIPGSAPDALEGLETPDAIFIGGGLTTPGTFDACWEALKPGGRLVANAVTLQSEALVVTLRDRLGGELTRLSVAHAAPLGEFEGWRTAMPVTTLSLIKP